MPAKRRRHSRYTVVRTARPHKKIKLEIPLAPSNEKTQIRTAPLPLPVYKSSVTIDQLSDDCIIAILQRVPHRTRLACERVSRKWHDLAFRSWKGVQHLNFWDVIQPCWDVYGDSHWEPQAFLQAVLERAGSYLMRFSLADCPTYRLSKYSLEMIANFAPQLQALDLSGRILTEKVLDSLPQLKQLRELNVSKCFDSPNFETRKNMDKALARVLRRLHHLESLKNEYNKAEPSWGKGGTWCQSLKLKSLSVGHCCINAEAFEAFATRNIGILREFRASEYTFTAGNWANLNKGLKLLRVALKQWKDQLQILELRDFTGSYAEELRSALRVVPTIRNLKELTLRGNKLVGDELLTAICGSCKQLQKLNISGTNARRKGLQELRQLPHLRVLDASRCKHFDDVHVMHLAARGSIGHLIARDCPKITKDVLFSLLSNCPDLVEVDLRGCRLILPAEVRIEFAKCDHINIVV